MVHKTDTQSPPIPMPRQTGLLKRGNIFHLNVRVPHELLPLYGKTKIIRRSLGTSDARGASEKLPYARFQLQTEFDKKVGQNKPRRGRFWVPLLALFHGLRLNEAAQLYIEDVGEEEGISCLQILVDLADGSSSDKRLKSKQSKRRIPIHPELLKNGFLDFVASRRADTQHPRLFPELTAYGGYFSNHFSSWFGSFKRKTLGKDCKATFHSFRHNFCTELNKTGASAKEIDMLGGWAAGTQSSAKIYDHPTMERLLYRIEKVEYPGLDLLHLHSQ